MGKLVALHEKAKDVQDSNHKQGCLQVYLIINTSGVFGNMEVIDDDGIDETGTLDEAEEGVGCSDHVAILVLQFGHEACDEDNASCDRKWQGKDR